MTTTEKHDFSFKLGRKNIKFSVTHNLKDFGLSIEKGFESWILRTNEFTKKSFIDYLKDKTPEAKIY